MQTVAEAERACDAATLRMAEESQGQEREHDRCEGCRWLRELRTTGDALVGWVCSWDGGSGAALLCVAPQMDPAEANCGLWEEES